jgi:protocatechuate 3,4-dioxygenase beta subunit
MRPFVVLLLVVAAVAALGLAVFTLLGSGPGTGPAIVGVGPTPTSVPLQGGRDAELEAGASAPRNDSNAALTASTDEGRTEVTGAPVSYPNSLRITVVDPNANPVAGAAVVLRQQSGPLGGGLLQLQQAFGGADQDRPSWRGTTDSTGSTEFRSLPPGNQYVLTASHPSYSRTELPYVAVPVEGGRTELVKLGQGFVVRGTVYDQAGAPIAGAHLLLDNIVYFGLPSGRSPDLIEAVTNDSGYYEISNIEAGSRNLTCSAKGYGTRIEMNLQFSDAERTPQLKDFRLELGHRISGKVLAPSRNPVANARIEVYNYDATNASKGITVTDAGGRFELTDLGSGEYMLTATAAGFSVERMNRVAVDGPALEIQLAQQGCAQGRVIDSGTKQPLTAFACSVRMVNPGTTIYGRPMQQAEFRNAKDGAFELCGLEPGTYVVQASAADYAPTYSGTFTLEQGMTVPDILVEISRGGILRGRVVDAKTGEPLSAAEIGTFDNGYVKNPFTDLLGGMMPRNTTQTLARTDRDGRFELAMLTPETYQIEISHHGHTTLIMKDLKVGDAQELDLGTLEMEHGAVIRGIVYGGDGSPLANAEVSVRANQGYRMFNARTGPDGRYVVESVPTGTYTVSATRGGQDDADPFRKILDMKKSEMTSTVSEGGDYNVDLYLGSN